MPTVDVLTRSYNNRRTGANLQETTLKKSNVSVNTFGRLFTRAVDGQVYAQPLIATNVTINGTVELEVAIVATTRNFVYAFDVHDPTHCDFLWRSVQLGAPAGRTDFEQIPKFHTIAGSNDTPGKGKIYRDFTEDVGITSTPAIDDAKQFLYVVAKSKLAGQFFNKIHKLDLATGKDAIPPVTIAGQVAGNGFRELGEPVGTVPFNQKWQLNRPGLLLIGSTLYIAFGSQGDDGPYHGWVFAYNVDTMTRTALHCTTPDWGEAGIWQSGGGLAFDDGSVYYVAGNGPKAGTNQDINNTGTTNVLVGQFPSPADLSSGPTFGNAIVRLDAATLAVKDWFSPTNTQALSQDDVDLCAGPILPEGTNMVLGFGKDGFLYACDRGQMGHWNQHANQNIQSRQVAQFHIHGTPVYWPDKKLLYLWSEQDRCLGYQLTPTGVPINPESFSQFRFNVLPTGVNQMPGGLLTLSANGDQDGIVWASHPTDKNANQATVAGTLRAFDADNLQVELWNSDHDPQGSDEVGSFAKFCPPVVANGKVYVPTFSNALAVYGLTGDPTPKPLGSWQQASVGTGVIGSASESCDRFTILGAGRDIWDASDAFHIVYQPVTSGGSTSLTAMITSVQNTDPWAKAGVMIRQSLDPASPHAMVILTPGSAIRPGNGVAFQHRDVPAGGSVTFTIPGIAQPHWVRIVRDPIAGQAGQFRFTGFHSIDGTMFLQIGEPVMIAMTDAAIVGMVVSSHSVTDPNNPNSLIGNNQTGFEELNMSTFEKVELKSS